MIKGSFKFLAGLMIGALLGAAAVTGAGAQDEPSASRGTLADRLVQKIKRELMVTAQVEVVAYGALPRSERKSQRVFDTRIQDSII